MQERTGSWDRLQRNQPGLRREKGQTSGHCSECGPTPPYNELAWPTDTLHAVPTRAETWGWAGQCSLLGVWTSSTIQRAGMGHWHVARYTLHTSRTALTLCLLNHQEASQKTRHGPGKLWLKIKHANQTWAGKEGSCYFMIFNIQWKPSFMAPVGRGGGGGKERRRGRKRKCWIENVKEWTYLIMSELLTLAPCRKDWKRISAESSPMSPRRPNRSRDWTDLNWTTVNVASALSEIQSIESQVEDRFTATAYVTCKLPNKAGG